jgi:hypothetical protein
MYVIEKSDRQDSLRKRDTDPRIECGTVTAIHYCILETVTEPSTLENRYFINTDELVHPDWRMRSASPVIRSPCHGKGTLDRPTTRFEDAVCEEEFQIVG